jgi:hypothetical protein
MRPTLPFLLALIFAIMSVADAATSSRPGSVASQTFSIDGIACPEVTAWSGGDFVGTVVVQSGKKHVANIGVEPITIETVLPLSPALTACVADLCTNQTNPKTLQLTNLDSSGSAVGSSLQARNALLTELRFPALDAGSKEPLRLTLVFVAEQIRAAAATSTTTPTTRRAATPSVSNFKINITGLNTSRVSRIEPFTIKRVLPSDNIGVLRTPTAQSNPTTFPDLSLNFGEGAPTDWSTWRDDFFVNGKHLEADEKDGSLQILASDLHTVLFSLQLSHIGLLCFSSQPDANNLPNRARADLYCEQMTVGISTTASPKNSTTSADPTTPVATSNVTSPEDKGARDPADFARPPNTIRQDYSVNQNSATTEEVVKYSSTSTSDDLLTFYTQYFSSAGWIMAEKHENDGGPSDTHQIYGHWIKTNNDSVDLRLSDVTSGLVTITVNLKRAPGTNPQP